MKMLVEKLYEVWYEAEDFSMMNVAATLRPDTGVKIEFKSFFILMASFVWKMSEIT